MLTDSATELSTAATDLVIAVLAVAGFTFVWTFDHNGVFHLVQMPAIALLVYGLRSRPPD